ncbi:hypothetical protein Rleg2_4230 [Rhizobium leguminosarum bv. trifolii WSM2304]|uniref:Uncharacterized protein n=1 Tax=Rhizobium leguminosarum bv. trifolii (strain WSM2304) TaxID=395492 RepID=A0ABF7QTF8_RHILW|nr:hypothetical protein [Rhizobium leguminosarum]ACI57492.1 hypothetical protein Rleg2_4230 [Rhizobium leguminosarum bv. trifolii WSM2304]
MTTPVTLHMINDEPRILDVELAAKLGLARRAKIRDVIKRYADELSRYGTIATLENTPEAAEADPSSNSSSTKRKPFALPRWRIRSTQLLCVRWSPRLTLSIVLVGRPRRTKRST